MSTPPMHNLGSFFAANLPQLGQLGQVALQAGQIGIHVSPQATAIASLLVLLSQLHAAPANALPEQIPTVTSPPVILVPQQQAGATFPASTDARSVA